MIIFQNLVVKDFQKVCRPGIHYQIEFYLQVSVSIFKKGFEWQSYGWKSIILIASEGSVYCF